MFGKLNMAVLGCGNIAGMMAETMRGVSAVRSYAAASRDLEKAKAFAKKHGFKRAYGSYEELLQDKKVDLVYIATPHSEHYANAKLCIAYGKPVLCEKPFTVSAAQAEELFALADEKNVFIAEAMWPRYMPMLAKIREVLASRVIGDPVMLTANLGYNIRWVRRMTEPTLAGGTLLDVGVYTLNFASMMFGDDVLRIRAGCTYTASGVDEQDSVTLTYRDGRVAVLSASMLGVSDRRGVIQGTKGYMVIENITNFESLTVYDNSYRQIGFYKRPKQKTGYEYEVEACVRAIKSGWLECPEMPHTQTLTMMRMMDEIRAQFGLVYPFEKTAQDGPVAEETPVTKATQEALDAAVVAPEEIARLTWGEAERPQETKTQEEKAPAGSKTEDLPVAEMAGVFGFSVQPAKEASAEAPAAPQAGEERLAETGGAVAAVPQPERAVSAETEP